MRYWDFAATEGAGAQTAGVLIAIDAQQRVYIEDAVVGHWETDERNAVMKATAELDRDRVVDAVIHIKFEQEPGSSGVDAAKAIVKYMMGFPVTTDKVTGSKDVRLEPLVAQAAAKNVWIVRGDWNQKFIEELCAIPNGKFRDQGDAASGALNGLTKSLVQIGVIDD
jgi:predicted phage terminase large subunit-like protein